MATLVGVGHERTVECPVCARDGEQSQVVEHTALTMAPIRTFTADDGTVHVHEPVPVKAAYECSRGHQFELEEMIPCPTCGWRPSV